MPRFLASTLVCLVLAAPAFGQHHDAAERPAINAVRVSQPPILDGMLDEEAWALAPPVDRFLQQEPREGEPATERTEVRIIYNEKYIYIGIHAYDSAPDGIVATEMRRDSDRLLEEDHVQVILDTFNDQRNGYMFVTTPLGARLDQQVSDNGEGGGRGSNSAINRNWDGVWESIARVTGDGWTAEMAIPNSTLRFTPGADQVWGVNFMRNIRRKNEQVYWSPVGKAYSLARVSEAGQLTGLEAVSQGIDLKIKPFAVGGIKSTAALDEYPRDFGVDARYGVTPGLNLDLTYNTDFAQVEVDEQQVNLTRFSLFFPEKREFFLENAAMFAMGTGTSFSSTPVTTDLFFSRRVGLSPSGLPVPIIGGARLAGKAGRHNIAVMDIQTDAAFERPGDNFFMGRYSLDILARSRVGGIVINKEAIDGSAHYNRTIGVDANLAPATNLQITSYVAKTQTPGLDGQDMSWFGRVAYRDRDWNLWLNYLDVQDNFNPEVGFVQQQGIRATKAYFGPTPRPERFHIRMMEPMIVLTYITDQDNRMIGRTQHYMVGTRFDDDSYLNFIYQRNLDVTDEPFRLQGVLVPAGSYAFDEWTLSYSTNPAARIYGSMRWAPMEYYGGHRESVGGTIGLRASTQVSTELSYSRNDVDLPLGSFVTDLVIGRLDYAFSPRMTLSTLLQYNSSTSEVTSSIRFNFIHRPGSDLYIVYNGLDQTIEPQLGVVDREQRGLMVKFTYLIAR